MSEQSPEKLNSSEAPAETYSLASILSEYKSEAFIRNERRLSKEELEKRADEIIREMKRSVEEELSEPEPSAQEPEAEKAPEEAQAEAPAPAEPLPSLSELAAADLLPDPPAEAPGNTAGPEPEPPAEAKGEPAPQPREEENKETPPAAEAPQSEAQPQPEEPEPEPTAQPEEAEKPEEAGETEGPKTPEEPDEPEPEEEKWPSPAEERKRQKREARAERARRKRQQREEKARLRKEAREKEPENVPELTAEEAAKQYASGVASLHRRMIPAFTLSVVMALLLFLGGGSLGPEALRGGRTLWILQAAMQLAVMILGLDVLAKGVTDLLSAKPGCETVVLLANIAAEIDAVLMISGHVGEPGLPPYCVTAAFTLAFALWGSYCRRSAFRETIRAMRLASVPTVVSSEDKLAEEGSILNKKLGTAKGFLQRATEPDLPERFYHKAVPPCLLLLLVLALAAAYLSGTGAIFRCLAALSCAAAAMSATMVYARPFFLTAKRLSLSGAALAGWRGAEDMAKAVGLVIRDLDIYPENSVILNGMKVLSGAHVEKVVAYTGSVILATGSGLRRVFGELMRQYAAPLYRVEDFDCGTEGGVSAFIGAEQVLVGTGAYMNLMGIRVPGSVDVAGLGLILLKQVLFFVAAAVVVVWVAPALMTLAGVLKAPSGIAVMAVIICLAMAWASNLAGLSYAVGAFFAGIAVSNSDYAEDADRYIEPVGDTLFVPVFFVGIGLQTTGVDDTKMIVFIAIMTVLCVITKVVGCGLGGRMAGFGGASALMIGAGMVPRGEMALITAQIGFNEHVLGSEYYSTIIFIISLVTLVAPLLLKLTIRKVPGVGAAAAGTAGAEQ